MRNKQDIEDLKQEYEIQVFTGKIVPRDKTALLGFFLRSRNHQLNYKKMKQEMLLKKNAQFVEPSTFDPEPELQVKFLKENLSSLYFCERLAINGFMRTGNLRIAAEQDGKNYETYKVNYRRAVQKLRAAAKEAGWQI